MRYNIISIFTSITLLLLANSLAASEKDYRDYIVYYSVFNSDFLSPEIAKTYKLIRAHDRILINISVHKKNDDNTSTPVTAKVSGSANDLIHTKFLSFKTIKEKNAIYHLGEFKTSGHQRQIFNIDIIPNGYYETLTLRFNHDIYAKKQ